MGAGIYIEAFFALLLVAALIVVSFAVYKRFVLEQKGFGKKAAKKKSLEVVETLYLDQKRRLVVVKHKDEEILLLLGASGETVIKPVMRKRKAA